MITIVKAMDELRHQAFLCKTPQQETLKEALELAVQALYEKLVRQAKN